MIADRATLDYYQREASDYVQKFTHGYSRDLARFLDRLTDEARVLELGCGGGRDSEYIANRGFALDSTDGTPAMAQKARERTGLPVRVMRFDELAAIAQYDAVWAHACLLHAPWADLPEILSAIYRALKPGGWHYANYKLGDGEGRDLLGRLGNFPRAEWLEAVYCDAGFEIKETQLYNGSGADGTMREWYALTVQKQ